MHIQVYDMDFATEENVTIAAYGKSIKHTDPFVMLTLKMMHEKRNMSTVLLFNH